jgi:ABC-type Fe3+/spermidine/putrescine transport system ATPase subunit
MNGGRLAQLGSPREIYLHPRDEFVARFIGDMNLLPARVLDRAEALVRLDCAVGQMRARDCRGVDLPAGSACLPGIRPEDVRIVVDKAGPGGNQVRGRVASGQFLGDATIYTVAVRSIELRIKAHHSTSLQVGDEVILDLPPEHTTTILPSEPAEDCDGHDPDAGGIVSGDADREARDVPA